MAYDHVAIAQERRGIRDVRRALAAHQGQHRRNAEPFALQPTSHIDIVGPGIFQCQANELAAPLDLRPIEELVSHGAPLMPMTLDRIIAAEGPAVPVLRPPGGVRPRCQGAFGSTRNRCWPCWSRVRRAA